MALVKWEPKKTQLEPLRGLREEVDRLFEDFFRGWPRPLGGWPGSAAEGFSPAVDLKESDKDYVLTAEVPGFSKDKIEITISEDSVTVKGERKEEKEEKKEGYYLRESSSGSFHRVVPLPGKVLADKAGASLKDGVLTLTLPKAEPAKTKGVKVKVE